MTAPEILIIVTAVVGFPFWMILVGFRVGDRVQRGTGSMALGYAVGFFVSAFPILAVVVIDVAMPPYLIC